MSVTVTANNDTRRRLPRFSLRAWWRNTTRDLGLLRRAFGLLIRADRGLALVVLALAFIHAIVSVALLWLSRGLINALASGTASEALKIGLVSALLTIVAAVTQPLRDRLAAQVQDRGLATVERELLKAGNRYRDLVYLGKPNILDEINVVRGGAMWLGNLFFTASTWYGVGLSLIGVLLSLAALHPLIPLSLLLTGGLARLLSRRQSDLEFTAVQLLARPARQMSYALYIATRPEHAAEVRMFGLNAWLRERYRLLAGETLNELGSARRKGLLLASAGSSLYVATLAGSFWYVANQAQAGALTIGDIALFINAIVQSQFLTMGLMASINQTHTTLIRLRHMFPFLDGAGPRIAMPEPGQEQTPPDIPKQGIALNRVNFTYPETDREILTSCSLHLPAGTVTALVGENGAGKSTLVKLLTRMYDPTDGAITLDGQPLSAYDLTALRNRLTVVYQDAARFAFSLADNIALADPAFSWTDPEPGRAKARQIADRLGVGAIAETLPNGYDTQLTYLFEGGTELSGGQWQLVTFARGLMRADAALAILDEPSSALDPLREAQQIDYLRAFARSRHRSVLLISHRLSTVRWADQIAVMEDGRITERGSRDALLTANGSYAELFTMQASRYRDEASPA